jgi:two-component system, sporulation sensor kinase E
MWKLIQKNIMRNRQSRNSPAVSFFENDNQNFEDLARLAELGKLSRGLFHDLVSPITALTAYVSNKEKNNSSPYADAVLESTKRVEEFLGLIRGFVENSDKEETFSVDESAKHAISLMRFKAMKENVRIVYVNADRDMKIKGFKLKFCQSIMNLISNAIDSYQDKEVGNKRKDVIVKIEKDNNFLIITVRDFGSGVKKDHTNKIFDLFFTTKAPGKGSGVGLPMVKQLVTDAFGGEIFLESEPMRGSLFSIKIPLEKT